MSTPSNPSDAPAERADERANERADTAATRDAGQPRAHPRPVRYSREVRLPLAIRKELLITRAALERYDCAQALHQVRGSAARFGRLGNWLPRVAQPASLLKLLGLARDYPVLSSTISLALPLLRKTPVLRWGWKLAKLGGLAAAGYWAYDTWQKGTAGDTRTARAPGAADTGFRDPLVR
ncbi:DUF3318 domain-containing protein [Cupriavidus sp. WS]|uniref:DUF3318 domain-containing protein n=1 Tax=Cupriavidus sp. WS TaxID=1312922 RepID=UPI00036F5605|nr:DUF3318 domain-containing protein [Cupriavidus sp. WS]